MILADHLEAARMIRFPTTWSRIWHDYDLLTKAGLSDAEALRIATQAEADRAASSETLDRRQAA